MKKNVIVITTVFVLLMTIFSFGNNWYHVKYGSTYYSSTSPFYVRKENVFHYLYSNDTIYISTLNGNSIVIDYDRTVGRIGGNSNLSEFTENVLYSNHNIMWGSDVFFSPPARSVVEVALEDFLPNLMNQVGGITGVALVIFGTMLAVLLVIRFLRLWVY